MIVFGIVERSNGLKFSSIHSINEKPAEAGFFNQLLKIDYWNDRLDTAISDT